MSDLQRWLILRLESPMVAFGGAAIDQAGVTRDFPAASMLAGLIANALGWTRTQWELHQKLQDRLVFAARREREDPQGILTDMQNARLSHGELGWTTRGTPQGRDGGADTFKSPHRRQREYHADSCLIVALRLEDNGIRPTLDEIAAALQRPARPLFLGRKACIPSAPILHGEQTAPTAYAALCLVPALDHASAPLRALWPFNEGPSVGDSIFRVSDLADLRNWKSGLHGGTRRVVEGRVLPGVQQ